MAHWHVIQFHSIQKTIEDRERKWAQLLVACVLCYIRRVYRSFGISASYFGCWAGRSKTLGLAYFFLFDASVAHFCCFVIFTSIRRYLRNFSCAGLILFQAIVVLLNTYFSSKSKEEERLNTYHTSPSCNCI